MSKIKALAMVMGILSLVCVGHFICFSAFADEAIDIDIIEVVDDGGGNYKPWEDITDAMPGATYSAIPRVKNNGSMAVEVRMCLSGSVMDAFGESKNLPVNTFEISINKHWILEDEKTIDNSGIISGNCYKYDVMIEKDEMTEPIFTEVTLSSALENEYENSTFSLHLDAFATGGLPDKPDTGALTIFGMSVAPSTIFYGLSGAAVVTLLVCFARALHKRK